MVWRIGVVLVTVLLAASGCSRSDGAGSEPMVEYETVEGFVVAEGATSPSGAEIAEGFVVPDGVMMVGRPIPQSSADQSADESVFEREGVPYRTGEFFTGYQAHFLVFGDPREVVDQLRGQAAALGITVVPDIGWRLDELGENLVSRDYCGFVFRLKEDESYVCEFGGANDAGSFGMSAMIVRNVSGEPEFWVSHMVLNISLAVEGTLTDRVPLADNGYGWPGETDGPLGVDPPELPDSWVSPLDDDGAIPGALIGDAPMRPFEGSWPAMNAVPFYSSGWLVVLEVERWQAVELWGKYTEFAVSVAGELENPVGYLEYSSPKYPFVHWSQRTFANDTYSFAELTMVDYGSGPLVLTFIYTQGTAGEKLGIRPDK